MILGDCSAWPLDEWSELAKHVPACFSIIKCGVLPRQGAFCAFHAAKKRGKK
jgi:hypothetical protein